MKLSSFVKVIKTDKLDQVPIISTLPHYGEEDRVQSRLSYIKMESLFCKASPPNAMVQSVLYYELDHTKTKLVIRALFGPLVQTQTRQTKWAFIYRLFGEVPMIRLERYGELHNEVMKFGNWRRNDLFLLCNGKTLTKLQRESDFSRCYFSSDEQVQDSIKYVGNLRDIPVLVHWDAPEGEILVGLHSTDQFGLVVAESEPALTVTEQHVTLECKFGHTFVSDGSKYYRRLLIEPDGYSLYQKIIKKLKNLFKR